MNLGTFATVLGGCPSKHCISKDWVGKSLVMKDPVIGWEPLHQQGVQACMDATLGHALNGQFGTLRRYHPASSKGQ